ncbi:MAG: (d)CMP kinase [Gammaproteobacteria bacterium]|nr:(d)CMP kinase [Gammaproteobacteria bacterium]MEE2608800.1 (d)CMP kinase [Pseudomonadota bacterium]MEE3173164.1 (d)CMP kinase [Pseudomonadota bacterium]|tara:strand:- start:275 stop:958 length:684 start_codon:yes stop_codon:yes gene_type:complete
MTSIPVITIDGPSGSGKGTVAVRIAEKLDFTLLDSGALYRSVGIAALRGGIDLRDHQQIAELARHLNIEFGVSSPDSVWLDGEDVSLEIRTDIGSELASQIGAIPAAREALYERQLAFRKAPGLVADGRDMGTVVFQDAIIKIYLTARPEERAQRRYKQLIDKGIDASLADLLRDLKERDARDSERPISPLKPAKDAVVLDTTDLHIDQVVEKVLDLVSERLVSWRS